MKERILPIIMQTSFDNAQSCTSFTSGLNCPAGCGEPLRQIITQIGCCYRGLYGNGDVQNRFATAFSTLSENTKEIFELLRRGHIFNACNVSFNKPCGGNSFLLSNFGLCNQTETFNIFSKFEPECSASLSSSAMPETLTAVTERFCKDDCQPLLSTAVEDTCLDPSFIQLNTSCLNSEGASLGTYCSFVLLPVNAPILIETFLSIEVVCGLNLLVPPTACTEECRARYVNLKDTISCCYQSIYNVSSTLDLLYIGGFIGSQDKVLLEQLRNPILWEQCNVDLVPAACGEGSGAVKFMASFVVMAMAMFVFLLI